VSLRDKFLNFICQFKELTNTITIIFYVFSILYYLIVSLKIKLKQ